MLIKHDCKTILTVLGHVTNSLIWFTSEKHGRCSCALYSAWQCEWSGLSVWRQTLVGKPSFFPLRFFISFYNALKRVYWRCCLTFWSPLDLALDLCYWGVPPRWNLGRILFWARTEQTIWSIFKQTAKSRFHKRGTSSWVTLLMVRQLGLEHLL